MHSGRFVDAASLISGVREAAKRLRSRPLLDRVEELAHLNRRHDAGESAWQPLNASEFGQPLYEAMGFGVSNYLQLAGG